MPDTDLFASFDLPTSINKMEGCFLSLIQRKVGFLSVFKLLTENLFCFGQEVIKLDDKYMIKMAENRGLFGSTTSQSSKKSTKTRKKTDKRHTKPRPRKKLQETEVSFSNKL